MFIRKIHQNLESTRGKILWWSMIIINFGVIIPLILAMEPKQYYQKTTNTKLQTKTPVKEYTK